MAKTLNCLQNFHNCSCLPSASSGFRGDLHHGQNLSDFPVTVSLITKASHFLDGQQFLLIWDRFPFELSVFTEGTHLFSSLGTHPFSHFVTQAERSDAVHF